MLVTRQKTLREFWYPVMPVALRGTRDARCVTLGARFAAPRYHPARMCELRELHPQQAVD
jgi:hypothetical protein